MKYLRFRDLNNGQPRLGRLHGETVELLSGDLTDGTMAPTGQTLPLDAIVAFLPPVEPPDIIAIGANYVDHCKEFGAKLPTLPLVFIKTTSSLAAHIDQVLLPRTHPDEVDFEAELAVVIGKTATDVPEAEAMDHVLGITCANDISARDVQLRIDSQWARGKSFDSFCPLGPWLDTDITDIGSRHVRLFLNGEQMQDQPVSDMIFSIPRIIAHLSAGITLRTGTVILTGTPAGVGMTRQPPRYLRDGDQVEVEVDGIGRLCNHVRRK